MKTSTVLGEWLDRDVRVIVTSAEPPFELAEIGASVVLLEMRSEMPEEPLHLLVKALVLQQPLAIVIHGAGARSAFDMLVGELSDGAKRKHVMTNVLPAGGLHDAIETLLDSTWPSEDRFDEWKEYTIVSVGVEASDIEAEVKRRLVNVTNPKASKLNLR